MAMDYGKCAKEIYEMLGGRDNLVSAAHCATRLRLVTVDNGKIDMKKLENVDGVKGVFSNNGQLQLIIGTGTVNKVYDEFLKVSGMTAATKEEVKAAGDEADDQGAGGCICPDSPRDCGVRTYDGTSGSAGEGDPEFCRKRLVWHSRPDGEYGFYIPAGIDCRIGNQSIRRKYFPWRGYRHDYDSSQPDQCMVGRIHGCGGHSGMAAAWLPDPAGRVSGACHSRGYCGLADVQDRKMAA